MLHIKPPSIEKLAYVMGPYQDPIARVSPGETFQVSTKDAYGDRIVSANVRLEDVIQMPFVNPCTGPIFVEGAEAGDTLVVHIKDISIPRDFGASIIAPNFGGVCGTVWTRVLNEPLETRILIHPITPDGVIYDENLDISPIPIEPFYGTIGTAPLMEAISTLSPGFHGGNMDAADICPGNTVYLPVHHPGALLYLGDGHAAQGDAEVCGSAIEIPTTGTFSVEVIKGRATPTPRVENDEYLMSIGSARPMEDAARIAFYDLITWLSEEYGFDRMSVYQLCSHVARVRVANMVDTLYSIVAKFPKRYLLKS
ncbi:MAG: Acetamidase/formamidase [Chloroflexi bacterium]|jgi:acetamidase/formamidase|nr:MAG: Acetamidase/formamidase [Chloroflexota bacterium]